MLCARVDHVGKTTEILRLHPNSDRLGEHTFD